VTDDEIMAALRRIDPVEFDAKIRAHIDSLGRAAGGGVTAFEVIKTGDVLFIVHASPEPTMALIRRAAEPRLRILQ
jgi:hypothetical protein